MFSLFSAHAVNSPPGPCVWEVPSFTVWDMAESVAALGSLSTRQGPVIPGEMDNDLTVTNGRPLRTASTLSSGPSWWQLCG